MNKRYCTGSPWCEEDRCCCEDYDSYQESLAYKWSEFKHKVKLAIRKFLKKYDKK